MTYLLDTSICVFFLRGKYDIDKHIRAVGSSNCYLSEITVAELKYGVECSSSKILNKQQLEQFLDQVNIIPFSEGIDVFAKEKARLRKCGTPVEDFDLFIGCTAVSRGMTLVTDNVKHFERIVDLHVENWVER